MADDNSRPLLGGGERLVREIERSARGAGDKFHPFTVAAALDALRPQADSLASAVSSMDSTLRGDRVVFQATLLPNYLAASWFPSDLLKELELTPLGARRARETYRTATRPERETDTRSLVVAGSDAAVSSLRQLMNENLRTRSERKAQEDLRRISQLRLATVDEVVKRASPEAQPVGDRVALEAVLHPDPDRSGTVLRAVDGANWEKWLSFVGGLEGEVDEEYRREVGGLTFVPVHVPATADFELARFNLLRAVRPLPTIRPRPTPLLRAASPRLQPPTDVSPAGGVRIAIFDGGVDDNSPLFPGVHCIHATSEEPDEGDARHGSAVTGAVLYGNLEDGVPLRQPASAVTHVRVTPSENANDSDGYWTLDKIREFVEAHDVDIVNLSLGPDAPIEDDDEPHQWTLTLDKLAYERGVLFVIAPGNHGERPSGFNRVASPSDMANGLSVGACDRHAPHDPWSRAAYSPVGPGRQGARVQPVGVQFGGVAGNPFNGLLPDGQIAESRGTSFAAPLVTHSLARLAARLPKPRVNANNLRAFAVHFADPPIAHRVEEVGHGRFSPDFDTALECDPNEVHVHYQGRIGRNQVLAVPVPWADETSGTIELFGTLVYTSPVEPTQPMEYTQASIDLAFRPHSRRFRMTAEGERAMVVNLADDSARVAQLAQNGYTPAADPITRSMKGIITAGDEEARRDVGKWDTIRVFSDRLRASSLNEPRIDLTYITREGGHLTRVDEEIDFTLLLTVRGPKNMPVYDGVQAKYPVLAGLPIDVPVRARATITASDGGAGRAGQPNPGRM